MIELSLRPTVTIHWRSSHRRGSFPGKLLGYESLINGRERAESSYKKLW
jgi:hypothetical protein